ncbi:MAG: DUF4041 domain-containing protein [Bacteroidia bacterium]|nr:DUF4041 domain-containing protein [Bacteroidia bacterium]
MSFKDIFNASSIRKENERLQKFIEEVGAGDALKLKSKIEEMEIELKRISEKNVILQSEMHQIEKEISQKKSEIIVLDEEILLESFALYKPKYDFMSSDEYKDRLTECRDKQKDLIKSGMAVLANESWTVNNSKAEGKKMVNDMKKLILRSFNNECDYCVDNVKFNNMDSQEKRIEKSFETLNKLGRIMNAKITDAYKKLKYEELFLAFEYQQKKQEEKEEQKRVREELREQQKLEQEIRQARERIAKEKKHFNQAIKDLEKKLSEASDESMRNQILEKLEEVKGQFNELEKEEKVIDYREQNAKAGYVYIISNIGAFGENVYKIGMTRRLEPMDRIDELGDASVPFSFDVHGLIFSDNAPALEAKLQEHFYEGRLNKMNHRKEFYRADIFEIEKVVKENYDKVVDIVKEAPAEQYRESMKLN